MSRRCGNCAAWQSRDSVWGDCERSLSDDARMAVPPPEWGPTEMLETKFTFGCVEWRSKNAQ